MFAFNLIYSTISSYLISKKYYLNKSHFGFITFFSLYFSVWAVWLIICGGQNGVGTDYESYYEIFSAPDIFSYLFLLKGEWGFVTIIKVCALMKLRPQVVFSVFYFINFIFLFKIIYRLGSKYAWIFILLYIAFSTVFNNQLNGLRQYTAIYIITYALINSYTNKSFLKFLGFIIFAGSIHCSSYLILPFYCIRNINLSSKFIKYIYFLSALFVLFGSLNTLFNYVSQFLPKFYSVYLNSDLNAASSYTRIITKLIFFPIYLLSLSLITKQRLSEIEKHLYTLGAISYALRLIFLENIILTRISQLFILLAIFPIYLYLKYLFQVGDKYKFCFIVGFIIAFYFLKTILFPTQEYLYQSIYFE